MKTKDVFTPDFLFEDLVFTIFVYDNNIRYRDERTGKVYMLKHSNNLSLRESLILNISPDCAFLDNTLIKQNHVLLTRTDTK